MHRGHSKLANSVSHVPETMYRAGNNNKELQSNQRPIIVCCCCCLCHNLWSFTVNCCCSRCPIVVAAAVVCRNLSTGHYDTAINTHTHTQHREGRASQRVRERKGDRHSRIYTLWSVCWMGREGKGTEHTVCIPAGRQGPSLFGGGKNFRAFHFAFLDFMAFVRYNGAFCSTFVL